MNNILIELPSGQCVRVRPREREIERERDMGMGKHLAVI